ncbi:MAG: DUF262 domain-containing protein [Rhodococcus sp.]|nr:DUF262 domain-containing protein [Rhodococcus sp. (in: high G+C Gram-positive bacteria)]
MPLSKVFGSDFDFVIPEYQRPYAWEIDQVRQLLEDLTDALDRDAEEPYFLGSVVLVKTLGSPAAEVIDGQQRLTSLTILLAVLRDLTSGDELRREIQTLITEQGSKALNRPAKPRLRLRARDAEFFEARVQRYGSVETLLTAGSGGASNDSQRAICANAVDLYHTLSSWPEERRLALLQMLMARTFLVVVRTADLNSAHRIFSVMNARGLDLTPADIFKSLVIGDLPDGERATYADLWENAEELLGRDDFADLFLHIRMIFAKARGRRELLKEFPEQVLSRYLPTKTAQFVDDVLVPYANAYKTIRDRTYVATERASNVNAWFERLSQLDNNDWRPIALWALRNHSDDSAWLDQFLQRLERLAASMFIRRAYTTPRIQRYVELLRELETGRGLDASSFDLTAGERNETVRHLDGDVYLAQKTRKYVLLRLDEALANNPGVVYDHAIITVEHVLPQTPPVVSEWRSSFTDDERDQWTHRLANLVLLNRTKNSEAQNYDFATKKSKYFTGANGVATFAVTSQVLSTAEWTPEGLSERQPTLLATLQKLWDL